MCKLPKDFTTNEWMNEWANETSLFVRETKKSFALTKYITDGQENKVSKS